MSQHSRQFLIRQKLENGTLPMNSIPRIWGGPGKEETCDACEGIITQDEMLIEGISLAGGRNPLQLHVECFHLWERERRAIASRSPHPPEIRVGEAGQRPDEPVPMVAVDPTVPGGTSSRSPAE
jgi:hypothetical protein